LKNYCCYVFGVSGVVVFQKFPLRMHDYNLFDTCNGNGIGEFLIFNYLFFKNLYLEDFVVGVDGWGFTSLFSSLLTSLKIFSMVTSMLSCLCVSYSRLRSRVGECLFSWKGGCFVMASS
jgi:hypothetical protein